MAKYRSYGFEIDNEETAEKMDGAPLSKRPADLQDHWDKRQQTLSQEEKDSETEYWEKILADRNQKEQLSLEEIADELNLIRTDVKAMFDDVRQINFDYMVYDINHRLAALEAKLRSELNA